MFDNIRNKKSVLKGAYFELFQTKAPQSRFKIPKNAEEAAEIRHQLVLKSPSMHNMSFRFIEAIPLEVYTGKPRRVIKSLAEKIDALILALKIKYEGFPVVVSIGCSHLGGEIKSCLTVAGKSVESPVKAFVYKIYLDVKKLNGGAPNDKFSVPFINTLPELDVTLDVWQKQVLGQ